MNWLRPWHRFLNPSAGASARKKEAYYNFYYLFSGIVQHELYHAGQIALLKKFK